MQIFETSYSLFIYVVTYSFLKFDKMHSPFSIVWTSVWFSKKVSLPFKISSHDIPFIFFGSSKCFISWKTTNGVDKINFFNGFISLLITIFPPSFGDVGWNRTNRSSSLRGIIGKKKAHEESKILKLKRNRD